MPNVNACSPCVVAFGLMILTCVGFSSAGLATQLEENEKVFAQLDVEVTYFEKTYGPAKFVEGNRRTYVIGGCNIVIRKSGTKISAISMSIERGVCDLAYDNNLLSESKFGDFFSQGGEFHYDCVNCGNAHDPMVYYRVPGVHANGYVDVVVGTWCDCRELEDAVRMDYGNDAVYKTPFDVSKYDNISIGSADEPIVEFTLGRNLLDKKTKFKNVFPCSFC